MESKSILVTGGCGFIGSNIVEKLLNTNVKFIRVLDNLSTGHKKNIDFLLNKYNNLEFMYGSITDLDTCRKAVKDIDIICHQAAIGSVPRSIDDPQISHDNNVNGFFNIINAARENNIKRIVYASSSSVYGDEMTLPKVEEKTGNLLSPYATTKGINELYSSIFTRTYNMEIIGLRYFNVFGPRQDPNGAYAAVIPKFINNLINNKDIKVNGDGSFSRDFTYIDNVVQANIRCMLTDNFKLFGNVLNIGAGGRFTIKHLAETLVENIETQGEIIYGEERVGDIPHSNASIEKAQKEINYSGLISFEEGLKRTLDWFIVQSKS